MLPDGPLSTENKMTLPTDVNLHLPIISTINNYIKLNQIKIDQIYPGIYLTNICEFWTNEHLRSHGFTHIIIIDKHIQNYATITENKLKINNIENNLNHKKNNSNNHINNSTSNNNNNDTNILNANLSSFSSILSSTTVGSISSTLTSASASASVFASSTLTTNEFEILDLNFGDESYLTTVLPNCYKAVKFIDKSLQYGGSILIIDRINNQKCLTITTAYLMYKYNLNFIDAFQKICKIYDKAELDKYFISQLYEYEPILQVQRAQSKGHSCSRELRMTYLKRKKLHDDHHTTSATSTLTTTATAACNINDNLNSIMYINSSNFSNYSSDIGDIIME